MSSPPQNGTAAYDAWEAEDKGPTIMVLCWTFVGFATLFMACRLYVRIWMFRQLRSDDYWCLAGLFCAYLSSAMTVVAVKHGNGRHYQTLSIEQQEQVRLWTIAAFCPGVMCFGLPKFAVVTLLTRLLNPSRWHRWFLWGMTVWCLLTLFATVGTLLGQCTPTKAMWNFDMEIDCVDPKHIVNFSLYAGALSAFVDLYLAVYPAAVLLKLQMKLKKKLALTFALSIGCVGSAVAIYKTTRIPDGLSSPDFSYDSSDLINWTIIEGSTIIIAATIPVLSPLMDKIFRGRNPFASSRKVDSSEKRRQYYYGDRSGSAPNDGTHPSLHSSKQRRPLDPLDPGMDLEETIRDYSSDEEMGPTKEKRPADVESQASTLGPRGSNSSEETHVAAGDAGLQRQDSLSNGQILRTNEVIVTYDTRDERQERLDRNIPWETQTYTDQWPLR